MRGRKGQKTINRRRTFRTCGASPSFPLQEKNHNLIQQYESIDDDAPLIVSNNPDAISEYDKEDRSDQYSEDDDNNDDQM